jgi:two-component system, LytTR family, response regulator AlgR
MSLRILIADDEGPARLRLRSLAEELGHQVCAEARDGLDALGALRRTHPDVVLLDIEMPESDGLSLAKHLEMEYPGVPVIFVTAHAEHAVAAFEAGVRDYLMKPVRSERLERALSRVQEKRGSVGGTAQNLRLRIGRKEQIIPLSEIDCLVAEDGYVLARSSKLQGFVDTRLHELEMRFGPAVLRVHRSCLVVKTAIAGLETRSANDHRILFRDELEPVPISRRQLQKVHEFIRGTNQSSEA